MIEKYYAAHIKTSLDAACDQRNVAQEKQERQERQESIQNTQASTQPPDEETDV
jgi:hypothetical protein